MLRDNLVGLIEPMFSSAGANPLALCIASQPSSDDRPPCLENPRPEGAESTLTENVASPFHAEPRQNSTLSRIARSATNSARSASWPVAAESLGDFGSWRFMLASRASRHHSLRVSPPLLATASRSLNSSSLTFVLRVLVRKGGFTTLHHPRLA